MSSETPPCPITTNFMLKAWMTPYTNSEPRPSPITDGFNQNAWTQQPYNEITANRTFLMKRVPDTSNVVETLKKIRPSFINPTTPSGTLQIGNVATNNTFIGYVASRSGTITLGSRATVGHHIGNGLRASNSVSILNGTYGALKPAGNVNILNGTFASGVTTGNVKIQTEYTADPALSNTGTCQIGNINSTVSITNATIENLQLLSAPKFDRVTSLPVPAYKVGYKFVPTLRKVGFPFVPSLALSPNVRDQIAYLDLPAGTWITVCHYTTEGLINTGYQLTLSNKLLNSFVDYGEQTLRTFSGSAAYGICLLATIDVTDTTTPFYWSARSATLTAGVTITNIFCYAYRIC